MLAVVLINIGLPAFGLYRLYTRYYSPTYGSVKLISAERRHSKKVVVIGCSNLQHNIDFKKVQKEANADVDFLYFSGSENSSFLQFLNDQNLTKNYDEIILYVPYNILVRSTFVNESRYHFLCVGCYAYSKNVIIHNPKLIFFNWNSYYDSISKYRTPFLPRDYIAHTDRDRVMDSLNTHSTTYSNCNEKFEIEKHIIKDVVYTADDLKFVNSLRSEKQKIFILFTPIPDIAENRVSLKGLVKIKSTFKSITMLNDPFLMDSTLFYDQWYHLNLCGQQQETANMISKINKLL